MRGVATKLLAGQCIQVRSAVLLRMQYRAYIAAHAPKAKIRSKHDARSASPLQVALLGGSVTVGWGATDPSFAYSERFAQLLNSAFPCGWVPL